MKKELAAASKLLTEIAQGGDFIAQVNLGNLHKVEIWARPATREGLKWMEKAADQGHYQPTSAWAKCTYTGATGSKDLVRAEQLSQKAVDGLSGSDMQQKALTMLAQAQVCLGQALLYGLDGLARDERRAEGAEESSWLWSMPCV